MSTKRKSQKKRKPQKSKRNRKKKDNLDSALRGLYGNKKR